MEVYVFKKPGFRKRQSDKLKDANQRQAILVDCDLNNDPKMLTLYAEKDVSLLGILFEVWANLDAETETWEISVKHFDRWARKTFSGGNRFDVLKRLHWLSNNGLISFQHTSNDSPTTSQQHPNDSSLGSQPSFNTPLDTHSEPENPHGSTRDLTNQTNQDNQPTNQPKKAEAAGCFFEIDLRGQEMREDEWIFRSLLEVRRSKNKSIAGCHDLQSLVSLYPTYMDMYRRWATHPTHKRMAAFIFMALHSNADNGFVYALKALEEGGGWKNMADYIRQAEEDVGKNDLKVVIK